MNEKHLETVAMFLFFWAFFAFISYSYQEYDSHSNIVVVDRNYISEVNLGISPNTASRVPTEKDIDTQLNLQTANGEIYRLFESREMISYGKTFVVRVK